MRGVPPSYPAPLTSGRVMGGRSCSLQASSILAYAPPPCQKPPSVMTTDVPGQSGSLL